MATRLKQMGYSYPGYDLLHGGAANGLKRMTDLHCC